MSIHTSTNGHTRVGVLYLKVPFLSLPASAKIEDGHSDRLSWQGCGLPWFVPVCLHPALAAFEPRGRDSECKPHGGLTRQSLVLKQ